jgi:hypothetical protein
MHSPGGFAGGSIGAGSVLQISGRGQLGGAQMTQMPLFPVGSAEQYERCLLLVPEMRNYQVLALPKGLY